MRSTARLVQTIVYLEALAFTFAFAYAYLSNEPTAFQAVGASDKVLHAAGSAGITGVLLVAFVWFPRSFGRPRDGIATLLAVGIALLGSSLETAQRLVQRDADPLDALANIVGIGLALGLWLVVSALGEKRSGVPSARGHRAQQTA